MEGNSGNFNSSNNNTHLVEASSNHPGSSISLERKLAEVPKLVDTMPDQDENLSDYILPINYSLIANDILSGLGRRTLESRFDHYATNNGFEVLGAYEVLRQIGTNPKSQYKLGVRDNWALKDRLTNFDAVVDQLFKDYQTDKHENGNSTLSNYAESFVNEISSLENLLQGFDVSNQRVRKVKNPQSVRFKHQRILKRLADKKREVAELYGLEIEQNEDTIDYASLARDIVSGKSANQLYKEHGIEVSGNHSWSDRLENIRVVLNQAIGSEENQEDNYFNKFLSTEEHQEMTYVVSAFEEALNSVSKRSQRSILANEDNCIVYQMLGLQVEGINEELGRMKDRTISKVSGRVRLSPNTAYQKEFPTRLISDGNGGYKTYHMPDLTQAESYAKLVGSTAPAQIRLN